MSQLSVNQTGLTQQQIESFERSLHGELIAPHHPTYDQRRAVWNGMIDRRPALIARCTSAEDVAACVRFARQHNLEVAVRGGAHNVAGHATTSGGLVIDLSLMKDIFIDPNARVARVDPGVTWGELDAAAQAHGLATPGGVYSRTGVSGLTLGGGFGWLRNKYGLSCDNLLAAEVVTASGELVRASQTQNSDLLWGLRGGGGNFGVVTAFEFRLHQVGPEAMFAFVYHDGQGEKMNEGLRFYRDFCDSAPDEVSSIAFTGVFPPESEHFPREIWGQPFFAIGALYAGSVADGQEILLPLRRFRPPVMDMSAVMPYVQAQQAFDEEYPDGMRYYWKSTNVNHLDDAVIDRIAHHARLQPSPLSTIDIWHIGGAVKRGLSEDSAFFGRHAAYLINPEANWVKPEDDLANIDWARNVVAALKPFSDGSRYLNFGGFQEEADQMMLDGFGPHYRRLAALKKKYDPDNLFRLNQNIQPEA